MSNIPKATDLLTKALKLWDSKPQIARQAVEQAVALLPRKMAVRKTAPQSRPMTRAIGRQVRAYAAQHPYVSHQVMADHFHVNAGRISEALNGKW